MVNRSKYPQLELFPLSKKQTPAVIQNKATLVPSRPPAATTSHLTGDGVAAKRSTAGGWEPLGKVLQKFTLEDKGGRITREFQDYAYRLSVDLNDLDHKSLYMRLAKTVDRAVLEQARTFVLDAAATSRAKLFMWKLAQLRKQKQQKGEK